MCNINQEFFIRTNQNFQNWHDFANLFVVKINSKKSVPSKQFYVFHRINGLVFAQFMSAKLCVLFSLCNIYVLIWFCFEFCFQFALNNRPNNNQKKTYRFNCVFYGIITGKRKEENQTGTPLFQTDEGRYLAASKCHSSLKIGFSNEAETLNTFLHWQTKKNQFFFHFIPFIHIWTHQPNKSTQL